ncbi:DUF4893 domain-containing protein [Paracoccus alkanivorans]|uniref:DUF4893 domain-containing protein n=2 Tax=Paracoccus alkanivorans TaxID=2116655 RepID=A0A3M0N1M6_9RHOB|nr:DUF4893 domain-containing protein [Paracoccus alkanivorans]
MPVPPISSPSNCCAPMPSIRRVSPAFLALLLALVPAMGAAQAKLADGMTIRPDDQRRLEELDASAGSALREAFASGASPDLALLAEALAGVALPPEQALERLPGEWSCRMMKLGNGVPLVVYQSFSCVVTEDGGFEKLTGSQRSKGHLHRDDGRLVYLGTGFIAGDTPPLYAELPDEISPQDMPQRVPEVGVVEITGPDRGRILFPDPYLESRMNLLALQR